MDMKKWLTIKRQFIGIVLLILILVGIVGISTYRQLSNVLIVITESTKPDEQANLTKRLLFDLTQAENNVKTYTLTNDTLYLNQYRQFSNKIEKTIQNVDTSIMFTKNSAIEYDSLILLIQNKFAILEELLTLQNEFRVEEALDKVSQTLDASVIKSNSNNSSHSNANEDEEKSGLFNWFNKKKRDKESTEKINESNASANLLSLERVDRSLRQIRDEEISKEELQLERELQLLIADKRNMAKIQRMLTELEIEDKKRAGQNAIKISEAVQITNAQIVAFVVVICLLLLFMSVTILRYITRSNRYRKVLRKAKNEAESLAAAKEHFVATVSHEIRTPMNIISGFVEQLSQSELDEQQKDHLNTISSASSHLLSIINEVLDFTKLQSKKLVLEKSVFSPQKVIQEVCDSLLPLLNKSSLELRSEIDKSIPDAVNGDAYRLRQVLLNILGNSIKFTKKGGITVTATTLLRDKHATRMRIVIKDTGIGMSPEQLARAFDEFEQAEASTTRNYGGTGLGLSITKQLVELQGGSIHMESRLDEGTTVTIEIPYLISNTDLSEKNGQEEAPKLDLTNKKVLIVDDEAFNRKLLISILTKYNATISEAINGKDAVKESYSFDYDVILMDARMPELNGIDASKEILKNNPHERTPQIIALTAAVTEEDRKLYLEAGMIDFIAKPFREEDLVITLNRVLFSDETSEKKSTLKPTAMNEQLTFKELKELSGENRGFYEEMLHTFIETTKSGIEDLCTAMENDDHKLAVHIAHRISSPCKHLGANKLYDLLKIIEHREALPKRKSDINHEILKLQTEANKVIKKVRDELSSLVQH